MAAIGVQARPGPLRLFPDDLAGEAATTVLRFHLRALAREEAGARAGAVEPVHQLRVATRRLRAALRLFEPVLPAGAARRAREDLARLARAIGAVRDIDVLLGAMAKNGRRLDASQRGALQPLGAMLREQRAAAHRELVGELEAARWRAVVAHLAALRGTGRGARLGDVAADLVAPLLRAVRRAGRRLHENAPAEAFHRLRVRVKRLRYALETLRGLGGRQLRKALGRLERLQEVLGEHQDAVAQGARLRELAERGALPPATLLAMGALMQVLGRRARRCRRRFRRPWRRFDRRRLRRRVLEELARHRRGARVVPIVRATGA